MKTLLVALREGTLDQSQLDVIREQAHGYDLLVSRDEQAIRPVLKDIEIAFGNFPRNLLGDASGLRWYQQWGAGADWLMQHPELKQRDFRLTNTSGVHAIPIAEHVLAFMLAFARGLPEAFRNQSQASWPKRPPPVFELAGKTMLLVGVGRIGEQTARLAQAFGMKVTGVRRSSNEVPEGVDELGDLTSLLPTADFVVLTVPLTEETRHMIGAAELSRMKPTAFIINIGRGGTIDETALIKALKSGQLAGAGLDVFEHEPLAAGSELWSLDNVMVTSHYSGDTPHYAERAFAIFMDNLERYLSGRELRNQVNREAGY